MSSTLKQPMGQCFVVSFMNEMRQKNIYAEIRMIGWWWLRYILPIIVNRNTVPGDKSALRPSGIRIGTSALTSRNFFEKDVERVVEFIEEAINLSIEVSSSLGKCTLKQYKEALQLESWKSKVDDLRQRVEAYALTFPMPGPPPLE